MKYLSDYSEKGQTAIFKKYGVFFAFSNKQFEDGKKEDVTYVSCGAGMIAPKEYASIVMEELDKCYHAAIAQDIAENGKQAIIARELANHECYYTGDISDCIDTLTDYKVTNEEIMMVYRDNVDKFEF